MTAEFVVNVVAGEPQVGGWCGDCLLPAVTTTPVFILDDTGLTRAGEVDECPRCAITKVTPDRGC